MRIVIVGLGVQGQKRLAVAREHAIATVDPIKPHADFHNIDNIALSTFDAALVCTPDDQKYQVIEYLLSHGKHVLVEKPLLMDSSTKIRELAALARDSRATCYTAYNHRFEPHIAEVRKLIQSGSLGKIYGLRMFYGNGTARDVRNSTWRDAGMGVLADLGSHLLDTVDFLVGNKSATFAPTNFRNFENKSFDHVTFAGNVEHEGSNVLVQLEATLLSWRNSFALDLFAEKGTAHINCLCKWGPSSLTVRNRVLPSGRPDEQVTTLTCADPTWEKEFHYFLELCKTGSSNIENDIWINDQLHSLFGNASK